MQVLLWLVFLLASHGAGLARASYRLGVHDCRCTENICRCLHRHRQPVTPNCHFPGGTSLPALQSCESHEPHAVISLLYLLPDRISCARPTVTEVLIEPAGHQLSDAGRDVSPPPPRASLA